MQSHDSELSGGGVTPLELQVYFGYICFRLLLRRQEPTLTRHTFCSEVVT